MASQNLVNIGLGDGFLPEVTEPLPGPTFTNNKRVPVAFICGQISQEMLAISIPDKNLVFFSNLRLQPDPHGAKS